MFSWKGMVSAYTPLEAKYWESIANTNLDTLQRHTHMASAYLHFSDGQCCACVPPMLYKDLNIHVLRTAENSVSLSSNYT